MRKIREPNTDDIRNLKEIAFREGLFGSKCSEKVGLLTGITKPDPVKKADKAEMLGTSAALQNNVGFIGLVAEELKLHETNHFNELKLKKQNESR